MKEGVPHVGLILLPSAEQASVEPEQLAGWIWMGGGTCVSCLDNIARTFSVYSFPISDPCSKAMLSLLMML